MGGAPFICSWSTLCLSPSHHVPSECQENNKMMPLHPHTQQQKAWHITGAQKTSIKRATGTDPTVLLLKK